VKTLDSKGIHLTALASKPFSQVPGYAAQPKAHDALSVALREYNLRAS
jgi:hypothetical protein